MTKGFISFRDFHRIRPKIKIPALDRVRLMIDGSSGRLMLEFECISCEMLLELHQERRWWVCPGCDQELTVDECSDLLKVCQTGIEEVLGHTRDTDDQESVSPDTARRTKLWHHGEKAT